MKACKNCKYWTKLSTQENNIFHTHMFHGEEVGGCHEICRGTVLPVKDRFGKQNCTISSCTGLTDYSYEYKAHPDSGFVWVYTLENFYCNKFLNN